METGHIHPAQCQCPVWLLQSKMDLCGDVRLRPGQWVSRLALPRPIWLQHTPVSPILLQDSPHRRLSSYLGSLRWNLDDSLIGNGHGTRRFTLSPNALFLGDSFIADREQSQHKKVYPLSLRWKTHPGCTAQWKPTSPSGRFLTCHQFLVNL